MHRLPADNRHERIARVVIKQVRKVGGAKALVQSISNAVGVRETALPNRQHAQHPDVVCNPPDGWHRIGRRRAKELVFRTSLGARGGPIVCDSGRAAASRLSTRKKEPHTWASDGVARIDADLD